MRQNLILVFAICIGVLVAALLWRRATHVPSEPLAKLSFYGSVVDESGAPVAGAEVGVAIISSFDPKISILKSERVLRTVTDAQGRFEVVDERGLCVNIIYCRKRGYEWVYDITWDVANPLPADSDNRSYLYQRVPQYPRASIYLSDKQRPAIFPLQHTGSQVTAAPSRGGSDEYPDGRIAQNTPIQPMIPTTGPSAPVGLEREHILHDLYVKSHPQQK